MVSLRIQATGRVLGTISDEDARILRRRLESASTDSGYFIDAATLDLLKAHGLSDPAIAMLSTAMARDGVTVLLEGTNPDELEEASYEQGQAALIADQPLMCVVCRHESFRHRRAQLHSAAASFFNLEWLGPTADCYICMKCGYVHWFIPPG